MPECGYCKDCRHWGDDSPEAKDRYRICFKFLDYHELFDNHQKEATQKQELAYLVGSYESDDFYTAPDFGCLSFEPKET